VTIANSLTLLRLILSPFFLLVYIYPSFFGLNAAALPYVLLGIFFLSELSDAFDGFLARRFEQVTELGKLLDPMADSIARISAFLTFTQGPVKIPILLVFLFIYRDSVISTLRTICALRGFALAARKSGKIKAVIQALAIFSILAMMIPHSTGAMSGENLEFYSLIAVSIAAAYTLFSGVEYLAAMAKEICD